MPFNTKCPAGHSLAVPSRYAGKSIACPKCKASFTAVAVGGEVKKVELPPVVEKVAATVQVANPSPPPLDVPPPPPVDVSVPIVTNATNATNATNVTNAPAKRKNETARFFKQISAKAKKLVASAVEFSDSQLRGVEHRTEKVHATYLLSAATFALAIFSTVPAWLDLFDHFRAGRSNGIATWAFILFFVGGIQCVYAIYACQLPDWSSSWVVTGLTLLIAMLYAMAFGSLLIGAEDSGLVQFLELQDRLQSARLWCACVLGLTSLVTYFGGRMSARWRHDFLLESGHLN